jgi:hypothetical protein
MLEKAADFAERLKEVESLAEVSLLKELREPEENGKMRISSDFANVDFLTAEDNKVVEEGPHEKVARLQRLAERSKVHLFPI